MAVELGHFCFCLALVLALIQTWVGLRLTNKSFAHIISARLMLVQFGLVLTSFFALMSAYILSDFSVINVILNSHTAKPLIYKVTALWSNHEGSLILWCLMATGLGASFVLWSKKNTEFSKNNLITRTCGFMGFVCAGFYLFVLLTSNPFLRTATAPLEGVGLNPLLQDPGLAFHPPILYLGYVGIVVPFAMVLSALTLPNLSLSAKNMARALRPWVLISWCALTLGITMGSWWAYYVLGWGGWWFWDPVENVALMPWLAQTALLHSLAVLEKKLALKKWVFGLTILTFCLCLMGAFLVRSGVLTSVHNFAVSPIRGLAILGLFVIYGGLAIILFGRYVVKSTAQPIPIHPFSRSGLLALNNIFLCALIAIIFLGTTYPLFVASLGGPSLSVGAPYFHLTVVPLIAPLVILLSIGQRSPWEKARLAHIAMKLSWVGLVCFIGALVLYYQNQKGPLLALLGLGAGCWIILTVGQDMGRTLLSRMKQSLSWWGMQSAHVGLAVSILGMSGEVFWGSEKTVLMGVGSQITIGPKTLTLMAFEDIIAANYYAKRAHFSVSQKDGLDQNIFPEKRYYVAPKMTLSQTALNSNGSKILYAAMGDKQKGEDRWLFRFYDHPWTPLVWYGGFLMVLGGCLTLCNRNRYLLSNKKEVK